MPHRTRISLFALIALAPCYAAGVEFTPVVGFDRQVFPSYIIATASVRHDADEAKPSQLGDPQGQFGVEIVAPADDTPIRVEVQCDDYIDPSVFAGKLPKAGMAYRVCPVVKFRYANLAKCTQSTPATAVFRVKIGADAEEEKSVTCVVRTINDCPFALSQGEGTLDVSYTFAAYVNEQHPFVDKLLREALDIGIVGQFDGYQAGPENAMRQAYALWDLLVARNIQYSSITVSAARSDLVGCQHVRMIEQSINNSQANCVDGSVLWASLMQKIGIDSFLVIEPTHCYAGFYLDPEHKVQLAIETTMVGGEMDLEGVELPEFLDEAIPEDLRDDYSFPSFATAVLYGTGRLNQSLETNARIAALADKAAAGGDESEEESEDETDEDAKQDEAPPIQVIDIPTARRAGILPIAFQNNEEFVWNDYSEVADDEESMAGEDEAEMDDESYEDEESYEEGDEESSEDGDEEYYEDEEMSEEEE